MPIGEGRSNVGPSGTAGDFRSRPAARSGRAAAPRPAGRRRPDPPDQAHRGADDGEPLLRQLPGHAAGRGDGLPTGPDGAPDAVQRAPQRPAGRRPSPDVHRPVPRQPDADLERQPPLLRRRQLRRVRDRGVGDRAGRRPGRADGLLDRGRAAVLPRAREDLPGGGPLVLLLPGPDLPEPAVPDRGHRARPGRRPAVGPGGLPGGRDDLRRADQQRHLLGQLPQREPGLGGAQAAARRARADRAAAAGAARPVAAGGDQRRPRQQVVHRRPVPAGVRAVRQSPADHAAVLRRRGGGDAALGVHRGPGLRRLLGGEPAGHRARASPSPARSSTR